MSVRALPRWFRFALPAGLSLVRIPLGILFPFAEASGRALLILLAGATDAVDGMAARRFQVASRWGGLFDATADKVFALAVLVTLALEARLAPWQLAFLLTRDAAVASLTLVAATRRDLELLRRMGSHSLLGKAATAVLLACFLSLVTWPGAATANAFLFALSAGLSFVAAVDYMVERVPMLHRAAQAGRTSRASS